MHEERERALLAVLAVAALVYSLMQSLVVPAMPAIQHSLGVSADTAGWAVTAFLLSSAVATPIAGRLGDMFGKGRVLVAVLVIVCAGTLLCTIPSLPALLGGRVIQGVSGGVLPLAYAIVRDEVDPARVGRGIALIASLLGVGGGLGVIIAGVLVEHLSYTSMFWVQLPAFAAVAWGVHRVVPHATQAAPVRIDWTGAVLVSSGLVMLLLTITQAGRWGYGSTATWLGLRDRRARCLGAWAWSALRHAEPLLDVRLMLRRSVWTTNAVAFLVGIGQFVGFIMLPRYVQAEGASPVESGVYLLPMTVAIVVSGLAAGRLERRFDPRTLLLASAVLVAARLRAVHVRPDLAVGDLHGLGPARARDGAGDAGAGRAGRDERGRGRDRRGGGREQRRAHARRRGRRAGRGGAARRERIHGRVRRRAGRR